MKTRIVDGFIYCELKADRRRARDQVAEFEKALQVAVPHLQREYNRATDTWTVAAAFADDVEALREKYLSIVDASSLF